MEDRISLRPTSATTRLGPSTDFFAAFRTGAGTHLRSKNRESQWEDKPNKKPEDRIRYSQKFLLSLREGLKELPSEINFQIACFTVADSGAETWKAETHSGEAEREAGDVTSEMPEASWRSRNTPTADFKAALNGIAEAPTPLVPEDVAKVSQLQKAEELGREAYRPRLADEISEDEKNARRVNGALNKLTPDNFERLMQQITRFVENADVLKKSISLVFEKAVAEPTFCALYANLCDCLSKEIPDFPPLPGETQKLTFRRVLLNTCQDEFEGVESSREKLASIEDPIEREAAEKTVKNRTLGNMRLISELFNRGLVAERIMHSCIKDLLQTSGDAQLPHEDNLEAVCEVLTLAGKKLALSPVSQSHIANYMKSLEKFSKTRGVASRIVFLIRDVMDMQKNDWVPRREKFTAKKIEEIHAEAETELGIQIKLPQPRQVAAKIEVEDELELFPMPKGLSSGSEWKAVAERLSKGPAAAKDTPPPPEPTPEPVTEPKPEPVTGPTTQKKEFKTEEEREKAAVSMFKEYLASADRKEAVLCAEEICKGNADYGKQLISIGMQEMFSCLSDRDHTMLVDLMVSFVTEGILTAEQFVEGLKSTTDQLDDLAYDIPKSPELCGKTLGHCIAQGHCTISTLPQLCQSILSAERRRPFALAVFKSLQANGHNVQELFKQAGLHAEAFLKADASFDMPDLESVQDFLNKTDFASLPL